MQVSKADALLIVDVQNTFCPGGTLPMTDGHAVVAPLNRVMPLFDAGRVLATQDWHPANHCSFKENGGTWPVHAVQNTPDAELHPDLDRSRLAAVIQKGTGREKDSFSGFDGTDLADRLRALGVRRVFIGGLATDYCVKANALDARRECFEVVVLTDACRAVNVQPGDGDRALAEMQAVGCRLTTTDELSPATV